jgi:hypothetical protein
MIGHDLKFKDLTFQFIRDLLNDFLQPNIDAVYKYLTAILRAEYHLVLAGVNNILIAFVCELGAHSDNYTAIRCIVKQNRALYPHPFKRGFYGASDKMNARTFCSVRSIRGLEFPKQQDRSTNQ